MRQPSPLDAPSLLPSPIDSDTADVDVRTAGPFDRPSSPSSSPHLSLNFSKPTWRPQPEPKPGFLVHPIPIHTHQLSLIVKLITTPTNPCGPSPGVQTPGMQSKLLFSSTQRSWEKQYQHEWVWLGVGGLLGVFWDSKD